MQKVDTNPPQYRETTKFDLWVKYFTDPNNKETHLNATQSALKAYNSTSYSLAGVIGHNNIKKYKTLRLMIADMEGFGIGELIKIGIAKALKGSYRDWDKLMVWLGYFEDRCPHCNRIINR